MIVDRNRLAFGNGRNSPEDEEGPYMRQPITGEPEDAHRANRQDPKEKGPDRGSTVGAIQTFD